MTIAIFGATGHLGGLVIDHLIARGADPGDILALGRNEERLAGLAARGLRTARVDLADPAELPAALAGVQKVLLISASDPGARVAQHRAVIDAAAEAGVGHLAYTSILQAPTSPLGLAVDHRATEDLIAASGIPATLLRNGWYTENYTDQLMGYLNSGVILGAAGEGRISAATRADFAEAAVAVLLDEQVAGGTIYELGGDKPFTLGQLAGALGAATGQEVTYRDLDPQTLAGIYEQSGIPKVYAEILVDTDVRIRDGALEVHGSDLARLIGRAPTSLGKAIKQALDS